MKFCDLFTIFELFLDRISSKRTCEQCTLTVHSEYTYIEERIASKQSKSAYVVPLSCGDTELLFGAVSVLPESRENAQVNSYQEALTLCYSLRNTLHVCYFYLVKIIFFDIEKNYVRDIKKRILQFTNLKCCKK